MEDIMGLAGRLQATFLNYGVSGKTGNKSHFT
jgi:hypothetical protein